MAAKFYVLCVLLSVGLAAGARPRPRLQQPIQDEDYDYEPQAQSRAAGDQVVLVAADSYDGLYRASDRLDDEYEPRALQRQPARLKPQQQQEGPKQPPVQTIRNYNKVNDDGSFTFGYEAADGSFKEETRGTDCVVRGKYGYVDPDGNKREFTYVSGNPCDPNKPNEEEEDEPSAPNSAERDDPEPNYPRRPVVAPRPTTPRPPTTFFQNDFRDADEDEVEDEPLQHIRQRVVQRPQPSRRPAYQAQPIAITPRPLQVTSPRTLAPPATTFRPQLVQVTAKPQIQYSPQPNYSPTPAPAVITTSNPGPRPGQIDFAAEFAKFHRENQQQNQQIQLQSTTSAGANPTKATSLAQPAPSGNPLYSTELVYDPSSGSYNTQLYQSLPQTKGELNLNQRLQPYVATQQQQPRPFVPSPQLPSVPSSPASSGPLYRHQLQNPQQVYQRQQSENQFQNSQQLFAQQQQLQQSQLQRDRAAARAQAQRLQVSSQAQEGGPQFYYVAPRGESASSGQIDAFLRGHGIQF